MTAPFYIGAGRRLADDDFRRIAARHGIGEAVLRAICAVEARGRGFHSSGAVVCLYEPHIAWRQTEGGTRRALEREGLACRRWRPGRYPASSFRRIDRCAEIAGAEVAALATSWGLGQIMGFNHAAAGYGTAVDMVRDFARSETRQMEGMVRLILSNPRMAAALGARDWETFARLYNGPDYKRNRYHGKLARAHREWELALENRTGPPDPLRGPPGTALRAVSGAVSKLTSILLRRKS